LWVERHGPSNKIDPPNHGTNNINCFGLHHYNSNEGLVRVGIVSGSIGHNINMTSLARGININRLVAVRFHLNRGDWLQQFFISVLKSEAYRHIILLGGIRLLEAEDEGSSLLS